MKKFNVYVAKSYGDTPRKKKAMSRLFGKLGWTFVFVQKGSDEATYYKIYSMRNPMDLGKSLVNMGLLLDIWPVKK